MSASDKSTKFSRGIGRDVLVAVISAIVVAVIMTFSGWAKIKIDDRNRGKVAEILMSDQTFQKALVNKLMKKHDSEIEKIETAVDGAHRRLKEISGIKYEKGVLQISGPIQASEFRGARVLVSSATNKKRYVNVTPDFGIEVVGSLIVKHESGNQILKAHYAAEPNNETKDSIVELGTENSHLMVLGRDEHDRIKLVRRLGTMEQSITFGETHWNTVPDK